MATETVVGIDLGTTNSEIAAYADGQVRVLGPGGQTMLPSCVGLDAAGALLVGTAARNQQLLFPERTIRSIKRRMGQADSVALGDQYFSPQEISALILRELLCWAETALGERPGRAVITVPAYFSDAQRQATREAGQLAGLEVLRIINEPTAASLAYGHGHGAAAAEEVVMVYDLGGGTFDVSVVRLAGDVTEVLASHGDNALGGDDFTAALAGWLAERFTTAHGIDLQEAPATVESRLWNAAEEAKKTLSQAPYAAVREDNLLHRDGTPLHLEVEVSRETYDGLIQPLVEKTLESVTQALVDAGLTAGALDAIILVGGATRTPLVSERLASRTATELRQQVHPDLCVALGAGVMASRLAGHEVDQVLVDVCPYSFGISHLGARGGVPYPHCFEPLIRRNTALPITRTKSYFTSTPFQKAAQIDIYQGEDEDALRNIPVGNFHIEGLTPQDEPVELLCRMAIDLNGILQVSVTEKETGLSRHVTVENALTPKSDEEVAAARAALEDLFAARAGVPGETGCEARWEGAGATALPLAEEEGEDEPDLDEEEEAPDATAGPRAEALALVERSREALSTMHEDDQEEAIELQAAIQTACRNGDDKALETAVGELRELLFFVAGKT